MGRSLERDGARQPEQPGFRGAVGRMGRHGGVRSGRGDVDDSSPTALFHVWQAGTYHAKRARQVDIDGVLPVFVGMALHGLMNRDSGTVHQYIRNTKCFAHGLDKGFNRVARANIQCFHQTVITDGFPGVGGQGRIPSTARAHGNIDSLFRQLRGNRQAYTLQSPGDDRRALLIHIFTL